MEVRGTGKSFFTKLLILRNYVNDIHGYIFDLEGEYENVTTKCRGENINVINNNCYINLLEIDKYDILESSYLSVKCDNVFINLLMLINSEKDKKIFINNKEVIIKMLFYLYNTFNITENLESVYDDNKYYINKKLKTSNLMPDLNDFVKVLNSMLNEDCKELDLNIQDNKENIKNIITVINKIIVEYKIFSYKSNVNVYNDLVNFNLKGLDNKKIEKVTLVLFCLLEKKIGKRQEKTLIYIDEFWKIISYSELLEQKVLELFKTIRKNNAGIVAITQDICDVFLKTSNIGRAIINNSCFLVFFKMEYTEKEEFIKSGMGFDTVLDGIQTLGKGNCILKLNSNIVKLNVIASENEKRIIVEEINDNNSDR